MNTELDTALVTHAMVSVKAAMNVLKSLGKPSRSVDVNPINATLAVRDMVAGTSLKNARDSVRIAVAILEVAHLCHQVDVKSLVESAAA